MGPAVLIDPEVDFIGHGTEAIIHVDYAPIEFDPRDPANGTWATYNQGAMTEYASHPGRAMKWESTDQPLPADVQPVVPVPAVRHEVTWHQVNNPPHDQIRSLRGCINGTDFYIPASRQVIPAGHLLFSESSARMTMGYDGQMRTELTLVYLEKHQTAFMAGGSFGWNYQWNPAEQEYDRPLSANGDPQFPEADLASMYT